MTSYYRVLSACRLPTISYGIIRRLASTPSKKPTSTPWKPLVFSQTGFDIIDSSQKIEEETFPTYRAERYYPVQLGEVFNDRYQTVTKLGYGASSTVWLARDLLEHRYVTLKICVNSSRVHRELPIFQHIDKVESDHRGRSKIRTMISSFKISGPDGDHICFVQQPLCVSLSDLKDMAPDNVLPQHLVQGVLREILPGLDFLHTEAGVIHTDIQTGNLITGLNDESLLSLLEEAELERPAPRKVLENRTIYVSRHLRPTQGPLLLCDFGEARLGSTEHNDDIMPNAYRAPEVMLEMNWSYPVDMWSLALTIWNLFEPTSVFKGRDDNRRLDHATHLAEMIAVMGSPPLYFLQRSEKSLEFWDEKGVWRGLAPIPTGRSLEDLEKRLEGDNQRQFLGFIRKILRWDPKERLTAREAMNDPWLVNRWPVLKSK